MENLFTSVEFYIIAFIVAMSVMGFMLHPSNKDEAVTYYFKGILSPTVSGESGLYIEALEDGNLKVVHRGVHFDDGCVNALALTVIGEDLKALEKQTPVATMDAPLCDVVYIIDKLRATRYHLYFDSHTTNSYASTSIVNDFPFHIEVQLTE